MLSFETMTSFDWFVNLELFASVMCADSLGKLFLPMFSNLGNVQDVFTFFPRSFIIQTIESN